MAWAFVLIIVWEGAGTSSVYTTQRIRFLSEKTCVQQVAAIRKRAHVTDAFCVPSDHPRP